MFSENNLIQLLEEVLDGKRTFKEGIEEYRKITSNIVNLNSSKINCIYRTILTCESVFKNNTGWRDLFVNLRMVILCFNRKIKINDEVYKKFNDWSEGSDLIVSYEKNIKYLNVVKSNIEWLGDNDDLYSVYDFSKKAPSLNKIAKGDFRLKNMTTYESYSCTSQKLIIRAIENQLPGTTILSTMPTGGGKSLPNQFVSFYEEDGTTVIVVPTVALAIDQCKSSNKYFKADRVARAYYDGVSNEEKNNIFKEIYNNKVAILYLSPESLLNGKFNDVICNAAKKGIIKRLVVDEAHIIAEWGEFFRTEFQFLSVFRRRLLELTNKDLKTVLLSATVTRKTELTLKKLYSENNNFIQIRGDSLRNEISYYCVRCQNDMDRKKRVLEVINRLPRPLIIYVPVIQNAHIYYDLLKERGYSRVRMFTSETSSRERELILRQWEEDRVDIIVATSAFGMGVNKKEVRAVVHTFLPESIDRFYQEVGRGGRDGYTSLSMIFTSLKDDDDYIQFFTRSKVLTVEIIVERWQAILDNYEERPTADTIWVPVEAVPERLKDEEFKTGSLNIAWNEYVLLFLFKKGIIDIKDIKRDPETKNRRILIKLLNLDLVNNIDKLREYLRPIRELERAEVDKEINYVKEMIVSKHSCWSNYFLKLYEYTETKCNGCPVCRKKKHEKYTQEDYFEVEENEQLLIKSLIQNRNNKIELIVTNKNNNKILSVVNECINNKIDCLVLNEDIDLRYIDIKSLRKNRLYLFSYNDFLKYNRENYINGNVAVIFTLDDKLNDMLYRKLMSLRGKGYIKTLEVIVPEDIYIISEGKTISNVIEGNIKYLGG